MRKHKSQFVLMILLIISAFQAVEADYSSLAEIKSELLNALSIASGSYQAVNKVVDGIEPDIYVPIMVDIVANGDSPDISSNAAIWLSAFYTDNGSLGYLHIKPLEENIETFLGGLSNIKAQGFIVEVLGGRSTSDGYAPCLMSQKNLKRIITALEIQKEKNSKNTERRYELNHANPEINRALANLGAC